MKRAVGKRLVKRVGQDMGFLVPLDFDVDGGIRGEIPSQFLSDPGDLFEAVERLTIYLSDNISLLNPHLAEDALLMQSLLQQKFKLPIRVVNPFSRIDHNALPEIQKNLSSYALALGMAMWDFT